MAAGMYIAMIVLTLLAIASFLEGGVWNGAGIVCSLAILSLLYISFEEDVIPNKHKEEK